MDLELWIFITTACLFACCVGAIAGHVATRWSMLRDLEEVARRKDTAVEAAMNTAFELQRVSGDTHAVGPSNVVELFDQDALAEMRTQAERCVVIPETGSVLHRYACDFGPNCPAPGGPVNHLRWPDCPEAGGCRRPEQCETGCHWRRLDALNRPLAEGDGAETLPRSLPGRSDR